MHKVNENFIQKVHKEKINKKIQNIQSNKKEESQKYDTSEILLYIMLFSLQLYI